MQVQFCECPICHKMAMAELRPSTGDSYIITEVNTQTKEFLDGLYELQDYPNEK